MWGGGRNYSRNVLLLPAKSFVWTGDSRRQRRAAKTAGVEAMLNYVYRRAPAEPLGSPNLSKKGFSFSCAVENLLEQKTARFALDSVPGVWPGGAGEGGDPNKTHQPGLL